MSRCWNRTLAMMNVAHTSRRQDVTLRRNQVQQARDTLINDIAEACGLYLIWEVCASEGGGLSFPVGRHVPGVRLRLRKLGGLGTAVLSCQQH